MIYNPKHFYAASTELIHEILRTYNFATLISVRDSAPIISHLPLTFDPNKYGRGALFGHMARANPQWRNFSTGNEVTAIFGGPHAYISPRWYEAAPDNVPTWNYAVVHVQGTARIIKEEQEAYQMMQDLVELHDPLWTLALSDKDRNEMMNEIVVFEIEVAEIEAKLKLSQNRSEFDRNSVVKSLLAGRSDQERETAAFMQKVSKPS